MSAIDMDWVHDLIERHSDHIEGNTCTFHNGAYARMAEEIAATVGTRTDLASRLRKVTGLRSFAELFGFSWTDGSDWDWHDVACAMADAIDATAGVGTCTIVKTWTDSDYADHWRYSCSECGYQIEVGERDIATGNPTSHANFCWNCGRRCIGIKEVTE